MFYLALVVSITLPHVCGALEEDHGRGEKDTYFRWFDKHVAGKIELTAEDCYSFRCGVLHQGRFGDLKKATYARILFVNSKQFSMVNCSLNDAFVYSVTDFCQAFIDAARLWWLEARDSPVVQANLPQLVQYRPEGMAPYIIGAPVIA